MKTTTKNEASRLGTSNTTDYPKGLVFNDLAFS